MPACLRYFMARKQGKRALVVLWPPDLNEAPDILGQDVAPRGGIKVMTIMILCWVLAAFRPNLAPRPVATGRARKMVQNEPMIRPGDQF